jgi:DNA-binding MarR family transcriptional regulator
VLTPQGRSAIAAAAPAHVAQVRRTFLDALDAEQIAALTDVVETVLAHLDAHPEQAA